MFEMKNGKGVENDDKGGDCLSVTQHNYCSFYIYGGM